MLHSKNVDIPLIKKVASTGKPIIISTGMATVAELDEAIRTAREAGCRDVVLLKMYKHISSYTKGFEYFNDSTYERTV
ncbi:hypothetical protein GCM10020331_084770 [Ectobacillus funiculus]